MGRLAILIATVLWVGGASAQTLDIDRMSKDELNKLTPEQTKTLPVFKALNKVDPHVAAGLRALVPLELRDLGYGFREAFTGNDEQLQRWVTQFQHDISEPETGVLTFGQMDALSERSDAIKTSDVHVSLPLGGKDGPIITLDKDFAYATGTFIIEGDEIYHTLNITTFDCFREWGYCSQADVDIDDKFGGSSYYVNAATMLLKIVSWNDEEVVANNEAICSTTTTTINSKAKEVYQITRNNGQSRTCGPLAQPLAKPQISKLVSGFNVSQDYYAQKRKEADGYRNKEYQEYLAAMRNWLEPAEKGTMPKQSKAQTETVPSQQ